MSEGSANNYYQFVAAMKSRTKKFALDSISIMRSLPRDEAARVIGRQLLRSATSVGANYRASCRVRTRKELAAKLRIVLEESDESQFWSELLMDSKIGAGNLLKPFHREATELTAILTKALDTTRSRLNQSKRRPKQD